MCVKLLRLNYYLKCVFLQIVRFRTGQTTDFSTTVGANILTYLSPPLDAKTSYTFRVAALNGPRMQPINGIFSPDIVVQTNFSGML